MVRSERRRWADGLSSFAPADGTAVWKHAWPGDGIVQPALTNGDILIGTSQQSSRISVVQGSDGWTIEERWTSNALKPYFNDFVIHRGYAYGFDGRLLACIDIEDGKRKWKGGRYGGGQLILLADQDVLLVVSEKGEIALVSAKTRPASRSSHASRQSKAEPGTTRCWSTMSFLFVNGEEMAAFRLALADESARSALP